MAFTAKFDPGIPQELRALPPRMVVRRKGGGANSVATFWFIGILFGGIGLFVLAICVGQMLFPLVAIDTHAQITKLSVSHGKSTTYEVQYAYSLSGRQLSGSDTVSHAVYNQATLGQIIKVRAAIIGPWPMSEISSGDLTPRLFLWIWALIWNSAIFATIYSGVIIPRRLVREGTPVMGQITGKTVNRGKNTTYSLDYSFQPMGGDVIARTMAVSRRAFDSAIEGQPAVVLFDPVKPKRSLIYEYAAYQAAGANLLGR